MKRTNPLNEICFNCKLPYGAHHGGTSPWPRNYCPDPDCRMDWERGSGTIFEASGVFEEVPTTGRIVSNKPNMQEVPK